MFVDYIIIFWGNPGSVLARPGLDRTARWEPNIGTLFAGAILVIIHNRTQGRILNKAPQNLIFGELPIDFDADVMSVPIVAVPYDQCLEGGRITAKKWASE